MDNTDVITQPRAPYHLLWVYGGDLHETLDAATWLDTARELRPLGWRVTLLAAGPPGPQKARGVDIMCVSRPDVYFLRQIVFSAETLLYIARMRQSPDVLLFDQNSALWLLPVRLMRWLIWKNRRPVLVMDIRSLDMPPPDKQGWKGALRGLYRGINVWAGTHWADGQTAITPRMAESVHISAQRLWGVWPSGVDPEMLKFASVDRQWPKEGMPIHLIYVGVLHYERNLTSLCQAVQRANSEGMPFILTLVGDGTERTELERLATASSGRIRWVPPVPHEEIPVRLGQAHIGVLPFPDEEKFRVSSPIKLFEYMAAGLPVLATRIVCHTDVIGSGDYVFWADGSDAPALLAALRLAWERRADLSQMGAHAAAAATNWTWRVSATKLAAALEYGLAHAERGLPASSCGARRRA